MINADFIFAEQERPSFSGKVDEDKLFRQFQDNLPVHFGGREFMVVEINQFSEPDNHRLSVVVREII